MAKTSITSVDQYIASQPVGVRPTLARVRQIIRKAVPKADELISYKIPTYKLHGDPVIYFAAWKQHYSVYPATRRLCAALGTELLRYTVQKATIRFLYSQPVPDKLIARVAKLRAQEVAEQTTPKANAAAKKRTATAEASRKPKLGSG